MKNHGLVIKSILTFIFFTSFLSFSKVQMGAFHKQANDEFLTNIMAPTFRPGRSNVPSASNPMVSDSAVRQIEAQRQPLDNRERAQQLVREYTEGSIKGDVFSKGLCQLGIDARPGSDIAKLQTQMENGDERVGFRAFNRAIAMQFV